MRVLDEWCFQFTVETPDPVDHALMADGLLWGLCVGWAEHTGHRIGGGVRPASGKFGRPARRWLFEFGMYHDDGMTPESSAAELWALIGEWCLQRGFTVAGGFDAFPAGES